MSLLLKVMQGSERRTTIRRERRSQREALRKKEDPTIYQVKQKLRKHPDPYYSSMSEEELTREALHLTDRESLKQFFSDITHGPTKKTLGENGGEIGQSDVDRLTNLRGVHRSLEIHNRQADKVGQLTLKLHLRRLDDTPSAMTRFGTALLKIPYGVLHACLEIGDSCNPELTYIVEFNRSSLVQPRRTKHKERSALEATVHLGGGTSFVEVKRTDSTPPTPERNQQTPDGSGQYMVHDLSYVCQDRVALTRDGQHDKIPCAGNRVNAGESASVDDPSLPPMPRPRSTCMRSRAAPVVKKRAQQRDVNMTDSATYAASNQQEVIKHEPTVTPKRDRTRVERQAATDDRDHLRKHTIHTTTAANSPPPQASRNPQNGKHLTDNELALSKTLFINELVSIIISYNKYYYYHSFTRNCQTFVVDVLQCFGAWENFTLGDKLEQYLGNLTKGRQEVYKSHKSVNDRVKYLVVSGEINEITYDEARYLRSLYTVYHLDKASGTAADSRLVCDDRECLFKELEKRLNEIRPV